mmetsp:Transcript_10302/g.29414  ORF Transcript_10302/g.29414 Transcript_10302/m.29414 type:complete len:229 (-) Transcript_10302:330-1016(-)
MSSWTLVNETELKVTSPSDTRPLDESPGWASRDTVERRCEFRSCRSLWTSSSSMRDATATSAAVGSSPRGSSSVSWRMTRVSAISFSCCEMGTRTSESLSWIARRTAPVMHQVAYVLNKLPAAGSYFSAARISATDPSCMRSWCVRKRAWLMCRFTTMFTSRRLLETSLSLARRDLRSVPSNASDDMPRAAAHSPTVGDWPERSSSCSRTRCRFTPCLTCRDISRTSV